MFKSALLGIIFLILSPSLSGINIKHDTNKHTRFYHLTIKDGLPGNHITCLQQDENGFIWIGTRKGLVRYDGHAFKQNDTLLSKSYVTDLCLDQQQALWVATKKGLYKLEHNQWKKTPLLINKARGLSHAHIRAILPDEHPYIWVETVDGNLHYLNTQNYTTEIYPHDRITQEYYDYHNIYKDRYDRIWLGGRNLGPLYLTNHKTFKYIETHATNPSLKRDKDVASFFEDSKNNFWVCGTDGLYLYNRKNDTVVKHLQTSTYDITEDADGHLWLATGNGLKCYKQSSNSITSYQHFEGDEFSLIDNHTTCLMIDQDHNIWVGTREGLSILTKSSMSLKHFRHHSNQPHSINDNKVTCLFQNNDTSLWIGTGEGGLNLLNLTNYQFKHFKTGNTKNTIGSNRISCITGTDTDLWIGLWQGVGFSHYHIPSKQFHTYAVQPENRKADWYNDLWLENDTTLWCGIWGSLGLHQFNIPSRKFNKHNYRPANSPANNPLYFQTQNSNYKLYFGDRGITYLYNDSNKCYNAYISSKASIELDHLNISTANIPQYKNVYDVFTTQSLSLVACDGGLFYFDSENKTFDTLSSKTSYYSIAIEPNHPNHVWLASERGIEFLDIESKQLHLVENNNNSNGILKKKTIKTIHFYDDKTLLVATTNGNLSYNTQLHKFDKFHSKIDAITKHQPIQSVKVLNNTLALILKRGFILYSTNTSTYTYFSMTTHNSKGMYTDLIYDIINLSKNNEAILASNRGLIKFNIQEQSFEAIKSTQKFSIYDGQLNDSTLHMCTNEGLIKYNLETATITKNNQPQANSLTSHLVSFLYPDNEYLWVGTTNRGINRINLQTNTIKHYYADNLKGSDALCMHITTDGKYYIGGQRLNEYNTDTEQMQSVDFESKIDDLPVLGICESNDTSLWVITANQLYQVNTKTNNLIKLSNILNIGDIEFTGTKLIDKNNNLWLGTKQGLLQFKHNLTLQEPSDPVRLSSLTIMGRDTLLHNSIGGFSLAHNSNFIKFSFSAMNYSGAKQVYEYRLLGLDKKWQSTSLPSSNYTNLLPGTYNFEVRLKNKPATTTGFQFRILPPFWKSWWFITLCIIILLATIVQWWRFRLKRLSILEKNLDLRQKLLLSQMNPHFIFNTLAAIQSFIFNNDPQTAGGYLSKFAKLMRLYLQNMRSEHITLSKEIETLTFYLSMQQLRLNNSFKFKIETHNIAYANQIRIPCMMLQPLVENAVEHGVRGIENGVIHVIFRKENTCLNIEITDNGQLKRSFSDKDKHCSVSTQIIQDRIENFSKGQKEKYYFKLEQYQEYGDTGTIARLKLPIYID